MNITLTLKSGKKIELTVEEFEELRLGELAGLCSKATNGKYNMLPQYPVPDLPFIKTTFEVTSDNLNDTYVTTGNMTKEDWEKISDIVSDRPCKDGDTLSLLPGSKCSVTSSDFCKVMLPTPDTCASFAASGSCGTAFQAPIFEPSVGSKDNENDSSQEAKCT